MVQVWPSSLAAPRHQSPHSAPDGGVGAAWVCAPSLAGDVLRRLAGDLAAAGAGRTLHRLAARRSGSDRPYSQAGSPSEQGQRCVCHCRCAWQPVCILKDSAARGRRALFACQGKGAAVDVTVGPVGSRQRSGSTAAASSGFGLGRSDSLETLRTRASEASPYAVLLWLRLDEMGFFLDIGLFCFRFCWAHRL